MNDISPILDQLRLFADQNLPSDMLSKTVPVAVLCLVAGVGLSVLGAKLARFGLGGAFVALGGLAGVWFGRELGFPQVPCALFGAVMIGAVGFLTFRLWVGLAAAVVLSVLALGAFGYQRVLPHVPEFQAAIVTWSPVAGPMELGTPSPQEQPAHLARSPRQWIEELWAHVAAKDAHIARHGKALALAALVGGLCLGVVAVRWTLILATSLVGTVLVTTAATTLIARTMPDCYQAFASHPGAVGMGVGGFLATSLIVQTLLTRKAPRPAGDPAPESS